jgi:hypothetical protein
MKTPEPIADDLPFLTALRRDLHAHPELGFEEERTSDIVAKLLTEASPQVHRGLGITGVVGTLQVGNGTRTIGLRADMDALAMPEKADRPYKSTRQARCTPAAMTGTRRCCSAPRAIWPPRGFFRNRAFHLPARRGRAGRRQAHGGRWPVRSLSLRRRLWPAQHAGPCGRRDGRCRGAAARLVGQLAHHLSRRRNPWRQAASRQGPDNGGRNLSVLAADDRRARRRPPCSRRSSARVRCRQAIPRR